ncbi:MAG: hypothetical protein Q9217_001763 [Psora testacea]
MSVRTKVNTTYDPQRIIQPIYTGGDVALDADGKILATCLGEEAVLTDLTTAQLLARIEGDGEVLTTLSLTPSTSHLVACSRSLSMKIYALQRSDDGSPSINVTLTKTLKPHTTPVITAAMDQTSTLVATGGADGVVKVWDIRGAYATHIFRGHAGIISAMHFFEVARAEPAGLVRSNKKKCSRSDLRQHEVANAPLGDPSRIRLASGSEDGKIRIWELTKRKSIAVLDSHVSIVRSLDYIAETNSLVSGSRDKTAIIWDASTWTSQKVIPVLEGIEAVGFLERGSLVYTGGEHGQLRLWNTHSGNEMIREQEAGGESDAIVHILRNTQQQFVLTVHANQSLVIHSIETLAESLKRHKQHIDPLPVLRRISGTHDEIIDLAYVTPDRSLLALATNSDDIRLVSLANSEPENPSVANANYFGADIASLKGHSDIIICLTVDHSGQWLATGAKDNTARLWRIDQSTNTYEHYTTFTGHAESIGAISLPQPAPSTTLGADPNPLDVPPPFLLTGSQDRTIKRWTIPKTTSSAPKAHYTRKAHDKDINALALSPNSDLFASASQDRSVKIWSTEEGETQGLLRGHKRGVWSVVFAPKDTSPITGADGSSVSSSRGLILTGSGDKTLKIWSLSDYTCIRTLEGHTNSVLKVLWLPPTSQSNIDNPSRHNQQQFSQIASAGSDGLVKIWDPLTSLPLTTLDNHTDRIWALAFNPTDRTLVSGGGDSVITFWRDTSRETAAATSKAVTERVEQDQELQNCVRERRYREAITLALQLGHPARLLGLFQIALDTQPAEEGSVSGIKAVDEVVASLSDEQLLILLMRVRDWNTNARTATVAQRVLNLVVRSYSAERLATLGRRKGGKEVVEALRAYTERHYRRVEELWGESWIVEFLLGQMGQLGVTEGFDGEVNGREQDVIMV